MGTLISYLDNMFATLPKTEQMRKLKEDLLATMEEKYAELKREGKSENEAVGIVISEFGNIDELIQELGLSSEGLTDEQEGQEGPMLTEEQAEDFLAYKKKAGFLIGIGVAMCLAGAALLLFFMQLADDGMLGARLEQSGGSMLGLIALFVMIVPAIGLFVYVGMKSESYSYLNEAFALPAYVRISIEQRHQAFLPSFRFAIIAGVCLCLLSPVLLFFSMLLNGAASVYGVVLMLLMIASAVLLFVYTGNVKEGYGMLLQIGEYSPKVKEHNRLVATVAAIVWPLATCIFLIGGFVFNKWHTAWIVFPITGILFGMFSGAQAAWKGNAK